MRYLLEDPIIYNPGQTFLGKDCNIHIFLWFVVSLLKQCNLFGIFLQFSLPSPYTKLKLGKKNSGYTRPTLFVGWGRDWTCLNWKTPQKRKSVPRLVSMIVAKIWFILVFAFLVPNLQKLLPFSKRICRNETTINSSYLDVCFSRKADHLGVTPTSLGFNFSFLRPGIPTPFTWESTPARSTSGLTV